MKSQQEFINDVYKNRGYVVGYHTVMAREDYDWLKSYDAFAKQTYTEEAHLDRKTKELLQIVTLTALGAEVDHIAKHVNVALKEGATKDEILAALKVVFLPLGGGAFERGVKAWGAVVDAEAVQPEHA